ncbi:MAG: glycosyltransferase 87 family protein [Oryzihumus sp.]
MSLGVSLPNPLNALREVVDAIEGRGIPRQAALAVILIWPVAACLAWNVTHPDLAQIHADGNALWMDGHAYWMAWRHPHLYGLPPRALDAYLYSPAFAQVLWPLTRLGFAVFAAVWWSAIVATFWWLLKPLPWCWRVPARVVCGFELQVGNINAFIALMVVLALRRPQVWAFALLTKVTLGVGLLWHLVRREWGSLGGAAATTTVVVTLSAAIAPDLWREWSAFLGHSLGSSAAWSFLDPRSLAMRLLIAAALVVWGARTDRRWVLGVAVPLATPLLGLATLTALAALPRLVADGRRAGRTAPGAVDLAQILDAHLPHEYLPELGSAPAASRQPYPAARTRRAVPSRRLGANA